MYISSRFVFIKNIAVTALNGLITLIILLIAPMGLAGVITNTILIMIASFINATVGDRIICFLQPDVQDRLAYLENLSQSTIQPINPDKPHQN